MQSRNAFDLEALTAMARRMRRKMLDVSHHCGQNAHLGGGLSMVELMATLYGAVLHFDAANPRWDARDRFILSKGHGVLGFFSALWATGIISDDTFDRYKENGGDLIAHPVMNLDLGIESSNGSLGQGLSMAVGLALAARKRQQSHRVYVYLGDGECDEGSVWEAAMAAAHYRLDNLTAIVDHNGLQSDGASEAVMNPGDLAGKWSAFGWDVRRIDGHDIPAIHEAFTTPATEGRPKVLVARTVKGKGVPFMEHNNEWHHNRLSKAAYDRALTEMGEPLNV